MASEPHTDVPSPSPTSSTSDGAGKPLKETSASPSEGSAYNDPRASPKAQSRNSVHVEGNEEILFADPTLFVHRIDSASRLRRIDTAGNHSLGTRGKGLAFSFGVWLWLSLVETQILSMESSQTQPEGRASASFTQRRRSERRHLLLNRTRWRRWDQAALLENNEASRLFCAKGMEIIFVHLSEVEKKLSQRQEAPRPS